MTQGPTPGLLLRPLFLWARGLCWGLRVRDEISVEPQFPRPQHEGGAHSGKAKVPPVLLLPGVGWRGEV